VKLTNVGYQQHGKPVDYRGMVTIPVGETVEVPEAMAAHLLKTFPGQFEIADKVPVDDSDVAKPKGNRR
jgi:hypothetical protein